MNKGVFEYKSAYFVNTQEPTAIRTRGAALCSRMAHLPTFTRNKQQRPPYEPVVLLSALGWHIYPPSPGTAENLDISKLISNFADMKEIPIQVKEIAKKNGCNAVTYRGCYNGKDVYSIYYVQPDGTVAPTGLPTLLVYGEGDYDIVCGYESFDILRTIRNGGKMQ